MKIIQNYKLWLIVSVTFLLMFVAVCIFSAKNFYELDAYRAEKSENINQKTIITRLTNENAELKSEKLAVQSSENLESIVTDFIETHYRSNDEIKQEVLRKHLDEGRTVKSLCDEYFLAHSTVEKWNTEYRKECQKEPKLKEQSEIYEENRKLRKELEELKKENEFLKKAAAFFAKEIG